VAEYAEEYRAPSVHLARKVIDRLCNRLVDGFVEATDVIYRIRRVGMRVAPQPQDAGAQRSVLADQLLDRKAFNDTQHGMGLRGRGRRANQRDGLASRLSFLLRASLRRTQVLDDGLQNQCAVVA
jgi:hypothetical protein